MSAVHRVPLLATADLTRLDHAWRQVVVRNSLCAGPPPALGRVRWAEADDALHESLAGELATAPVDGVRAVALRTGERAELNLCADPAVLDGAGLDRLAASVLEVFRRPGPVAAIPAQRENRAPVPAANPSAAPPELVVLRDAGRPHAHFYYPGSGVGAAYRDLVAALPAHWTVTACDDVASANTVEGMSEGYLSVLGGRFARPDLLGGWSMGGLVGLDALRRLPSRGAPALLLLDSPPPTVPGTESGQGEDVGAFAEFLWESFGLRQFRPAELSAGDDTLGLGLLAHGLAKAGEEVPLGWLSAWLAEYRRQLRLLAGYVRRDLVDARAVLFLGELLEAQVVRWRGLIGSDLVVERLGGGHFDLLRPPLVTEVGQTLAKTWEAW
ncbi:thioesterase domain-containing protein [Amycolatopsis sp. 195334CR]|uniref:thioesterase domain-containing protein n=1 Tax=Amycolatopsis sp. 195334CR TaxID=2814588 RepID=UPI001A8FAA7C|nr:thioesterase domain-containing protein [Amycolatopsis sp. 195334CR]MBN6038827.1 hypothetical protein [Amycolatopsis sp. 195334CR]